MKFLLLGLLLVLHLVDTQTTKYTFGKHNIVQVPHLFVYHNLYIE